ncbi:MAG: glycosyltransferase family 2 protein [Acidimicrobiia bacterium]|nr:glycosyltransferase family 2 protein [Acidimicrobiia bacterium]
MRAASFVILTQGDRPGDLLRAISSIKDQDGVEPEIVVVSNGAGELDLPDGVDLFISRENLGIPGGRNLGAADTHYEIMFFLDDDAWYADNRLVTQVLDDFATDPKLGIVSLRLRDPVTGLTERRHVPRLRVGDPALSSAVTSFLGGACAIRRSVFERCGPYPKAFFYSHEESDLAWRAIDAGFAVRYRGDLTVLHPAAPPSRHPEYHFRSARNRVWLARRRLPWAVALPHIAVWTLRSLLKAGSAEARRQVMSGFKAGWSEPAGDRRPISWRAVWTMTKLGRPPVL